MKLRDNYFKILLASTLFLALADSVAAQIRQPKRRQNTSAYGTPTKTATDTTKPKTSTNTNSAYGTPAPGKEAIDTTLPITVIKSTSGGLMDSVKMSLRNDASVEQNLVKDREPLPYENIREDDAVYRVRVWREIDAREKMNMPFRYAADEDNGNQRFISILLRAIKNGDITAFSGDDDRFTTPITAEQAMNAFGGGTDTSKKRDLEGNVIGYEVRAKPVDPDSIYKFRLKEEWIFNKQTSKMYVRILGIAPVRPILLSNGEPLPNSEHALWWVYYPDLRATLAKCEVYNPKNYGARMTWEELFESRMFSSYITKSTLDNPFDLDLSQVYPSNTLFRLLEGENIKDKIFNYEQSLWSY